MSSLDFQQEKDNFREYYESNLNFIREAESTFLKSIGAVIEHIPKDSIQSRIKNREECINKFDKKYKQKCEEENIPYEIKGFITDLIGFRIICLYESDIEVIGELLKNSFVCIDETDKTQNLYEQPNSFGYKGLHLDLRLGDNRLNLPEFQKYGDFKFEVQIRTITQHAWSAIEHKLRYKGNKADKEIERRINRLAALFEMADAEFVSLKTNLYENNPRTTEPEPGEEEILPYSNIPTIYKGLVDRFNTSYFLGAVRAMFRDYPFFVDKASEFVDSILSYDPNYTNENFRDALRQSFRLVSEYRFNSPFNMNPYTMLRHILYYSDKSKFGSILREDQKKNFETWLKPRDN